MNFRRAFFGSLAVIVLLVAGLVWVVVAQTAAAKPAPVAAASQTTQAQAQTGTPYIGIVMADLNQNLANRLGLSRTEGVVITRVMPGSPAERDGLKEKDIINAVNGVNVANVSAVQTEVGKVKTGDRVGFGITRGSVTMTVTVTAGERPQAATGDQLGKGALGNAFREFQGIAPRDLFNHFLGGQFNMTDKDNRPITIHVTPGTISQVGSNSITVTPNGQSATVTYNTTADTLIHRGIRRANIGDLRAGDKVVVVTVGDSRDARIIATQGAGLGIGGDLRRGLGNLMPRGRIVPPSSGGVPGS